MTELLGIDFIVVYDDGTMRGMDGRQVSRMFDLADCNYMDGVVDVYAVDENNKLVTVTAGDYERDNGFPDDSPVVYGYTLLFAGTKRVGTIAWSDH